MTLVASARIVIRSALVPESSHAIQLLCDVQESCRAIALSKQSTAVQERSCESDAVPNFCARALSCSSTLAPERCRDRAISCQTPNMSEWNLILVVWTSRRNQRAATSNDMSHRSTSVHLCAISDVMTRLRVSHKQTPSQNTPDGLRFVRWESCCQADGVRSTHLLYCTQESLHRTEWSSL